MSRRAGTSSSGTSLDGTSLDGQSAGGQSRSRWRRNGLAVLASSVALVTVATGCSDGAPAPGDQASPTSTTQRPLPEADIPDVVPQPQLLVRLGEDIAVRGTVEIIVDPLVDRPTHDLVARVFRAAGASEVVFREPGAKTNAEADLTVRLGDRIAPMITKGLQEVNFNSPSPMPDEGYVLAGRGGEQPMLVIGASDPAGLYYAVQTLRQLTSPGRISGVGVVDEPSMPVRGAIEGFYGRPWSHQERLDQLAFYGDVKLNTYIYAPKDDPYHRELWREPYPKQELGRVGELINQAKSHHVKFTFALSPGNSICYSDPGDTRALLTKLESMYSLGVRDFSVPLDDISYTEWNCGQDQESYGPPSEQGAGRAQTELLNTVQHEFIDAHPDVAPLQMVPTEYSDMDDSAYKRELRTGLDKKVRVMWTGDGVIPKQVTVADAEKAAQVWGRKTFLWDNYPVNDFDATEGRLLVGPYAKRESGLHEQLDGAVVNPMNQAAASMVAELGAADFTWNDEMFDAGRAWRLAAEYLAGDRFDPKHASFESDPETVRALLVFFDLEHMSPLANGEPWQEPAPELARRIEVFRDTWRNGDRAAAVRELRDYAQRIADAPERIRAGTPRDFVGDAAPWLDATALWGRSLLATTDGLQSTVDGDRPAADRSFQRAGELARQAGAIRTVPGETRPQGPVRVADGVLDQFIESASEMR